MNTQTDTSINIDEILDILIRRFWYIVIPVIGGILLGVGIYFYLPKLYKSTTVIMVEKQKVPESFVKSSVSSEVGERLSTIRQQILRRSLLEKVVSEFNLYSGSSEEKSMDERTNIMREKIEIQVDRGGREVEAFKISYQGRDPETVMNITNRISTLFIEENLRAREEFVEGTSEFLDNELAEVKKDLEAQEDAIRKFRQKYMGELPEQTSANLRKLDRLQLDMQAIKEALSKAKERRSILIDQSRLAGEITSPMVDPKTEKILSPRELKLARLRAELLDLRKTYTEKYPDLVQIKREIAMLEGIGDEDTSSVRAGTGFEGEKPGEKKNSGMQAVFGGLEYSEEFRQIEIEIAQLKAKESRLKKQMDLVEQKVDNAPLREQTLLTLKRDYDNTKEHYQSLLTKKLNARISQNLEKRQKGEKFRILDPANFPIKPFSPNLFKVILLGFMGGAGLGGGLTYLRELMDTSFKKVEEVQEVFKFPVLASIPNLKKM